VSLFTFRGTEAFSGAVGDLRVLQSGGVTFLAGVLDADKDSGFLISIEGFRTLSADGLILKVVRVGRSITPPPPPWQVGGSRLSPNSDSRRQRWIGAIDVRDRDHATGSNG